MPTLKYYNITQTREVKVSAANPLDALALGTRVLAGEKKPEDVGHIYSEIVETDLSAREAY